MSFTWIPLYSEIARKVLEFGDRQSELLSLLGQMRADGLKVILLTDRDAGGKEIPLTEIDPFTFFASFNRTSSVSGRQAILAKIKGAWKLSAAVPDDFDGIPIANAQNSWAFAYLANRTGNDIPTLWRAAREGVEKNWQTFDRTLFDDALSVSQMGLAKLTMSLFWLNPLGFLPCDKHTCAYFKRRGIVWENKTAAGYFSWLEKAVASAGENFPQVSRDAYEADAGAREELLEEDDGVTTVHPEVSPTGPRFVRLIGAVLDALRSMGGTGTPKAVADWIVEHKLVTEAEQAEKMSSGASRFKNHVDWARFYLVKAGLISSAKRGIWALTPAGESTHPSMADALELFQRVQAMMEEETPEANTALELHENDPESAPVKRRYWWLNANPKIWDFRTAPIGSVQTYTSHNEDGNKRQKYKYFAAVQVGDLLLGYVTTPDKEIVAVCEVTKALHGPPGSEAIEFRKVEQFQEPLTWAELQSVPALADCEPLVSNQGSLFAVTEEEYDTIRAIIDERNLSIQPSASIRFTKADALNGLFMTESELDTILARLRRKKALILQGPPGVGKTFIARRLAFALMGERDERRVAMVQFHPSYGYEDFVQGYRPIRTGLERRDGVFYQFARLARNDPKRDWFFIIDEINRGNLAKIFGELLMLIEADKRGSEHAIPLTYSENADETFHLPANLHVIGTMNTADRSLAMVDYALRRRFAFVTLPPALDSQAFGEWLTERKAPDAVLARIRDRIGALNAVIEKERDLGAGFRIGHSFFCPFDDRVPDEAWYREIVVGEIQPLLEEYFDSRERVDKLIADLLD